MSDNDRTLAAKDRHNPLAERDLTGQTLGDFHVMRLLGRGGMGEVYLAEQVSLKRNVALKVLRPDIANDPAYLRRFEAEAKAAAKLNTPHIVAVHAIGNHDGIPYIAMEYVQGSNLREFVRRKGPLDLTAAITVMRKVANALQAAGENGIVHRDIKPENILLTKKGEVKVADFGLARELDGGDVHLTQTGVTMGTPLYMSPEQVQHKRLDPRSDIYSFGVTAYHMLAGEPPYMAESAVAVAMLHLQGKARPLMDVRSDIPADLARIVEKMMARDLADRYQSAREVLRDLNKLRSGAPATTQPLEQGDGPMAPDEKSKPSPVTALTQTFRGMSRALTMPKRRPWVVVLSLLLALGAGLAFGWTKREPNYLERARAVKVAVEPPSTSAIDKRRDGGSQLLYARNVLPREQREAGLWAVIDHHPDDVPAVLEASVVLLDMYLGRRDYTLALALGEKLINRDNKDEQVLGYLVRGVVQSRRGDPASSNESFLKMFEMDRKTVAPADKLEWLARLYFLAVRANADAQNQKPDPAMERRFWDMVVPRPV